MALLPVSATISWCSVPAFGVAGADYLFMEPFLRSGLRQGTNVSVNGGTPQGLKYFTSLNYDNNNGVLPNDNESKRVIRGNFSFTPIANLLFTWNASYAKDLISNTASRTPWRRSPASTSCGRSPATVCRW